MENNKEEKLRQLRQKRLDILQQRLEISELYTSEILPDYIHDPENTINYTDMEKDFDKLTIEIKKLNRRITLLNNQG